MDVRLHNMEPGIALLLSIRPEFAEQIFAGTKTVELRRIRPRVKEGDIVVVYASGDTKALFGAFRVAGVVEDSPKIIWRRYGQVTGISKREFDEYFGGTASGFAIEVSHSWRLPVPIALPTLRKNRPGFRPPQGYHYLDVATLKNIGGEALLTGGSALIQRSYR
jgi:predicted transcriptional regulator